MLGQGLFTWTDGFQPSEYGQQVMDALLEIGGATEYRYAMLQNVPSGNEGSVSLPSTLASSSTTEIEYTFRFYWKSDLVLYQR